MRSMAFGEGFAVLSNLALRPGKVAQLRAWLANSACFYANCKPGG